MKLPTFWPRRQPRRVLRQRLIDLPELLEDVEEVLPPGCGWFDSSHDLQHGLQVTEHASADGVAAELALDSWIGLHLAGWQPALDRLQ
jgi:hypothetical protein